MNCTTATSLVLRCLGTRARGGVIVLSARVQASTLALREGQQSGMGP